MFESAPAVSADDIQSRFDGRYTPAELCDSLSDFIDLGIVAPQPKHYEIPARVVERSPLKTLVLTLTTGCNLGCSYCYREDLTSPKNSAVMDYQTGSRSIDLLMEEASENERVGIVFFGGEPLTRIAVIRDLVDYAEEKAVAAGKDVEFSLTTNATLLTERSSTSSIRTASASPSASTATRRSTTATAARSPAAAPTRRSRCA